jgi:hypothetical protein
MLGRGDSPWYTSLRQFRQPQPGAWDPVVQAVAAALTATVEARHYNKFAEGLSHHIPHKSTENGPKTSI